MTALGEASVAALLLAILAVLAASVVLIAAVAHG